MNPELEVSGDESGKKPKKTKDPKSSLSKFAQLTAAVDKVFPKEAGRVELDANARTKPLPHIPTGSIIIDWLIGGQPNEFGVPPCPGLPKGRLVNLYGMESSGKTTLALTAAATTIANGGRVCYIDWEHSIDLRYALSIGVRQDPDYFLLAQPTTLEAGLGICYAMAKGGVELIIIDSVGAGVPKKLMEQKLDEVADAGRVGLAASKWGAFLPKLKEAICKSGSVVIGISQLREKIDSGGGKRAFGAGPQKQAQGGNSWKFYSELRIMLRRVASEKGMVFNALINKKTETIVGHQIRAKLDKCKVAPNQGAEADFYIRFGVGIDDVRSIIDIAISHNVIHKTGGSWLTWEGPEGGEELRANGVNAFRKLLPERKGAWEALYKQTLERMAAAAGAGVIISEDSDEDDDEADLADLAGVIPGDNDPLEEDESEYEED